MCKVATGRHGERAKVHAHVAVCVRTVRSAPTDDNLIVVSASVHGAALSPEHLSPE